ncbi:MAG: hypothetical protein IH571_05440, partial [Acholeplasmataceae bacterium]|nr:hypothetical protein [Acholeplasmataceae bacterium]
MKLYTTKSGAVVKKPFNKAWIILAIVLILIVFFWQFIVFNPQFINLRELPILLEKMFTPKLGRTWGDYFGYMTTLQRPIFDTLKMSLAG